MQEHILLQSHDNNVLFFNKLYIAIMKKHNFQIAWLLIVMLITACNNFTDKPQLPTSFAPDSLLTPTGNVALDSLLQAAALAPQDTNLVKLYNEIGEMYENNDAEKAKEYFLKVGDLSEKLDWNKGRYWCAVDFSNMLIREGLSDSALIIMNKALELAVRENDESWQANILCNIGNSYFYRDWHETALRYFMQALPFLEQENNIRKLSIVYYLMGQIYTDMGSTEKAIEYGEKSVALDSESPNSFIVLASAYSAAHEYEKADIYAQEALRLCELQNNVYSKASIYYRISDDAIVLFDLDKAEEYALKSLEIRKQYGVEHFAYNYLQLGKIEQLKGNYAKSEAYTTQALQIAEEDENLSVKRMCYTVLAELAIAQRQYRENVQYWEERDWVVVEIAKNRSLLAAEEMAAKYEAEKKDLEIKNQQNIINQQNMQRTLLAAGIVACLVILAMLWYMLNLRNRRNRFLAEINLTKDKFFNIISHDLKNPAISQRDTLQILVKNASTWDADTLADYHGELLKSADGQVELIMNLLSWSKLQTGRMIYTPQTFILSDLLPNLSLIRKMAENKHISLAVQIPENKIITADSHILATVIRNLMINAIKFTPSGGLVTLKVEPKADGTYVFTVSDTGTGMTKEQTHNLFRLDSTHSQRGTAGEQGSGLGLIVCRELLEKHGSTLQVESEEGRGSQFWFALHA